MSPKGLGSDGRPYNTERGSAINASFDPLTMCLDIADFGDLPSDFEIARIARHPTIFHELVHSWQLLAFTSGYITAAIRPIQSIMVPEFLRKWSRSLVKPLLQAFEEEGESSGKYSTVHISFDVKSPDKLAMFAVHKYYFDFEKLNAVLDDRERFSKDETRFVLQAFPPNLSYYSGSEAALLNLISMMRQEIAAQLKPLKWPGPIDLIDFIKEAHKNPSAFSREWTSSRFGIAHIQEAHARFLEMQLCASYDKDQDDFAFFTKKGYLGDRYTAAYKAFLEWSGFTPPSTVLDWRVHVFVLVCEYALNATAPYLDGFELNTLFDDFHPATRFKKASQSLANLPSLSPGKPVDSRFLKSAYEAIELAAHPPKCPSFDEALHSVEAFARGFFQSGVRLEWPFFNLTARHLSTVLLRTQNSSHYLNPLTIVLDGPKTVPFLFPPVIRTSSRTLLTGIPVLPTDDSSRIGYLIGLVYSDLVDQLLRSRGPFRFECQLIPDELKPAIIDAAKNVFKQKFGVAVSEVRTHN